MYTKEIYNSLSFRKCIGLRLIWTKPNILFLNYINRAYYFFK